MEAALPPPSLPGAMKCIWNHRGLKLASRSAGGPILHQAQPMHVGPRGHYQGQWAVRSCQTISNCGWCKLLGTPGFCLRASYALAYAVREKANAHTLPGFGQDICLTRKLRVYLRATTKRFRGHHGGYQVVCGNYVLYHIALHSKLLHCIML